MQTAILFLAVLPLAMSAAVDPTHHSFLFAGIHTDTLAQEAQKLIDLIGSDATEQKCEQSCHNVVHHTLLDYSCPFLCHTIQSGAHNVHVHKTTAAV